MANVTVERDGEVLRITLSRPDRRNAFDSALVGELAEAFVDVGRARAVVLAGEGRSFCAGADVDWMRASVGLSFEENVADANAMRQMFEAIDRCPTPVVARVQGHALAAQPLEHRLPVRRQQHLIERVVAVRRPLGR